MKRPRGIGSIFLLALLAMCGCGDAPQVAPSASTVRETASNLRYFHDARTDLCFAAVGQMNGNTFTSAVQITWVPCNDKVMEEIRK